MTRVIQVIEADEPRGDGAPGNPHRIVTCLYRFDGTRLCEISDWAGDRPDASIGVPKREIDEQEQQYEKRATKTRAKSGEIVPERKARG